MIKRNLLVIGGCTVLALLVCGEPVAQERQVYRYTDSDGRIVYSDRAPTSGAKDLSMKRRSWQHDRHDTATARNAAGGRTFPGYAVHVQLRRPRATTRRRCSIAAACRSPR